MLKLNEVQFSFKKPLLKGLSFSLGLGEILHIHGANGAGKTTLLRIVAGVLRPHEGNVLWNEGPLSSRKTRIGYIAAGGAGLYPRLSVRENLEYFGGLMGLNRKTIRSRMPLADPFGIDFWDLPAEECSQGMRQKVFWIRALLHDPEILLLDEAFNTFDELSESRAIDALLRGREGRVALMAQHGRKFNFPYTQLEARLFVSSC